MPRLLETHGCQGGAHAGYVRAGWDVTGVDINDLRPCHDALSWFVRWATEDPACRWANETDQGDL